MDIPALRMRAGTPLVRTLGLCKTYQKGAVKVDALAGIDLEIYPGDFMAISGRSGCGKSTLLAMLGALDRPTSGKVFIGNIDISRLDDARLSDIRSRIGFVFQTFNLFQNLSVVENVEIGMSISSIPRAYRRARAKFVLDLVGLGDRMGHRPGELSGGQQQRVAIARALAREPAYLLLDEPTGNLDSRSATEMLQLIKNLNRHGATIVMVTHDPAIARQASRSVMIRDGRIDSRSTLIRIYQRERECSPATSCATR
jgi:putative ABC transport system ATP-binding protein